MSKYDLTYIIDDDPIFVLVLKKMLDKLNHFTKVKNLRNGQEAVYDLVDLNENKQQFPDLIFLDLNMPVLDGWQFLEEIEALPFKNKLNIYIISSTIDKQEIDRANNYKSVKSFISKPINSKQLSKILELD